MWPDLAAQAIEDYTNPGDIVLDPLAGIGTTLVEAIHAGRNAIGVELESGWAALAEANVAHARNQGGTGHGRVVCGDATHLPELLGAELRGQVALVLTSPPYGRTTHGRVEHRKGPLTRFANTYGKPDQANLAHRGRRDLLAGFTKVLAGCVPLLKPGGIVVITARPWRRDHYLIDLPSQIIAAGIQAGLQPLERCVALLAAIRSDRLLPRHSFFQLAVLRKSRVKGLPVCLVMHEDILVLGLPALAIASDSQWPGRDSRPSPGPPVVLSPAGLRTAQEPPMVRRVALPSRGRSSAISIAASSECVAPGPRAYGGTDER
jgi:SAM-dependent methyltransferase